MLKGYVASIALIKVSVWAEQSRAEVLGSKDGTGFLRSHIHRGFVDDFEHTLNVRVAGRLGPGEDGAELTHHWLHVWL